MAGRPYALPSALHADRGLVAQLGRAVVRTPRRKAIRRGSFDSVRRPEQAIARWLEKWNQNARPFRWTKSAADIKRSISNAALIYDTGH